MNYQNCMIKISHMNTEKEKNKIAIWTVTRGAAKTGQKIKGIIEGKKHSIDLYVLEKFQSSYGIAMQNFTKTLEEKFSSYEVHIFVMASGIVVRKISKLLQGKDKDPAILLIDEAYRFVISLVSGHLGKANAWTKELAKSLSLIPVITTSSDITGKIAVDTIAQKLDAELENLESAKEVTSFIVDGKQVDILLPNNVRFSESGNAEGVVLFSNREKIAYTRLYPKNLIVGIGCRKNTDKEELEKFLKESFQEYNLSIKSIRCFSTVDVKENEEAILVLAKKYNSPLEIHQREAIKKVQDMFLGSDFVEKQIGVRAVSEPCALLSAKNKGKFLIQKKKKQGMTISVYEEEEWEKYMS